jgi:hypothetical protein
MPLQPAALQASLDRLWSLSGEKIHRLAREYDEAKGAPVFTVQGRYTTRGWTEWTQGFQFGSAILQFDATGDQAALAYGRDKTVALMAPHLTHFGVHDHGFNNVSTYGNLLRLLKEGRLPANPWEQAFYELALKCSGAVQARRWATTADGGGYIYSFNGPQSLFADTIRSLRILAVAHRLGHRMLDENDRAIPLLERLVQHARATAKYNVWYGRGRDAYDIRGRTAHESIFNRNDGNFRCPSTQQGYSAFSTWTRGLAWVMLGFAEELEFLATLRDDELAPYGGRAKLVAEFLDTAQATCDFYIAQTPSDGIPYWDTGAPGLAQLGDYLNRPAEPFNDHEPVDSSAAAIAAQALLRLGHYLQGNGHPVPGRHYWQAGLTVLRTLLSEPYLSADPAHHGLLLHTVYHRPNGWDFIPPGRKVPCGESCMWGDYHLREAALYLHRILRQQPYYTFFA